jgi:hypothetical protein
MYRAGDCPVERERCDSRLPPVVFGLIFSRHSNYRVSCLLRLGAGMRLIPTGEEPCPTCPLPIARIIGHSLARNGDVPCMARFA